MPLSEDKLGCPNRTQCSAPFARGCLKCLELLANNMVGYSLPSPGAMDAVELARKLQEEATCSICLDYFTDPVMTTCGHNFCRECIRLTWEKAKGKKGRRKHRGSFPCPECRELSPQRNLRPNRLLTKVAEMARQHPGLQSRDLCKVHQEQLKLFCEDDQHPICVVCRESREHRPHRVVPVEEAVQEHKVGPGRGSRHQGDPDGRVLRGVSVRQNECCNKRPLMQDPTVEASVCSHDKAGMWLNQQGIHSTG